MVVLEGPSHNSHSLKPTGLLTLTGVSGSGVGSNNPNQYLQPDYLTPLPTTLDAKKSPLALLVQTCSQIGADSPSMKFDTSRRKSSINIESTKCESEFNNNTSNSLNAHHGSGGSFRPRSNESTRSSSCSPLSNPKSTTSSSSTAPISFSGKISPRNHSSNSKESEKLSPPVLSTKSRKRSGSSSASGGSPVPSKMHRVSPPVSSTASTCSISSEHHLQLNTSNSSGSNSSGRNKELKDRKSPGAKDNEKASSKDKPSSSSTEKSAPQACDPQGANPIIRSGLEVLHGGSGRLHANSGVPLPPSLSALSGYPGGFSHEAFLNPAFRLPFLGAGPGGAGGAGGGGNGGGYPSQGFPGLSAPNASPYVSYTRVKTPSGGESIVPVCRDPYCTGCQFSPAGGAPGGGAPGGMPGGMIPGFGSQAGICPAGCAQCDHQKIPYASFYPPSAFLSQPGAAMQMHAMMQHQAQAHQQQQQAIAHAASAAAAAQSQQTQRPYICNWIVGDNYCGKKFQNSEELLQHLRTHTQNNANGASGQAANAETAALLAAQQQQQQQIAAAQGLYSGFFNPSALAAMQQMQQHQQRAAAAAAASGYPPSGAQQMQQHYAAAAAAASAAAGKGFPPGYFQSPYGLYGQRVLQ